MVFAKELPELMKTSHFHLFMMPIVFVITGHLFLLSAWGRRSKTVVISSCFAYRAGHLQTVANPHGGGSFASVGADQLRAAWYNHVAVHLGADLRDVVFADGSSYPSAGLK